MTRLATLLLLAAVVAAGARLAREIPVLAGWLLNIGVIVYCGAAVEAGKVLLTRSRD